MVGVVTILVTMLIYGLNDITTPVILPLIGTLGIAMTSLVSALKATEGSDTAAKTAHIAADTQAIAADTQAIAQDNNDTVKLTASKTSSIMQALAAHCGEICPNSTCPLREIGEEVRNIVK